MRLAHAILMGQVRLSADHGLADDVFDAGPYSSRVKASLFECLKELSERTLMSVIEVLLRFVENEVGIVLIDRIVRQMHVHVVEVLGIGFRVG